ncbi:Dyp-type peroxidase [Paraburkholderia fungorum]|uniref:Dyp-type peroxidase n=1 Tax=Paraburkholderia fungorum TaxID=134537 RepID=UPI0038BC9CFE
MPNFRAGIDDNCGDFSLIARLNAPFDDRATMIASLQAVAAVQAEKLDPKRTLGFRRGSDGERLPRTVVGDLKLSLVTAFGLRFFLGPLEARGQEEAVQNFPPGGVFKARIPSRFGISDRPTPLYLRTMAANGDRDCVSQRLTAQSPGAPPTDAQVTQTYQSWLSQGESDLILQVDARNQFAVIDLWDALRDRFVKPFGYQIVSLERGFTRGDGRAHIGFIDGVSNLQQLMTDNPEAYRRLIYLPTPAPAYPGYPVDLRADPNHPGGLTQNCDDMRFDGGTYMVYRKYALNLKLWFGDDFEVADFWGHSFKGDEARLHAIGRDRDSGLVIDRASRCPLHHEPDHTEINRGFNESHALKARGGRTAPFSGPFPPVPVGFGNVFDTQDIRIRRRSIPYGDLDPATGEIEWGLHFICYQNNIQQAGFEFINNIWLFNPDFRRSVDGLFNPAGSVATPLLGAYYFVPPPQHAYPGDCLFE